MDYYKLYPPNTREKYIMRYTESMLYCQLKKDLNCDKKICNCDASCYFAPYWNDSLNTDKMMTFNYFISFFWYNDFKFDRP